MALLALVHYGTAAEYRQHFEREYCRGTIVTFDGIRVYFAAEKFGHAFYESTSRSGRKDMFSPVRAQRIGWIRHTLEHPDAALFAGWNKQTHQPDVTRRVAVVYEDFVVIVAMSLRQDRQLKATFITCYQADNSIGKIRAASLWEREACLAALEGRGGR